MDNMETKFITAIGDEQKRIRLECIKDIIDYHNTMAKWGVDHYKNIVSKYNFYELFSMYYDLPMEDIHLELERLGAECSRFFQYISDSANIPDIKDIPGYPFK